jgi:hypothetical protein
MHAAIGFVPDARQKSQTSAQAPLPSLILSIRLTASGDDCLPRVTIALGVCALPRPVHGNSRAAVFRNAMDIGLTTAFFVCPAGSWRILATVTEQLQAMIRLLQHDWRRAVSHWDCSFILSPRSLWHAADGCE